ncbi:ATP-binding protein [Fictibacillus iocasae]|uniref:histidine kinase n=1 Tax=Fictibacillus iocasae TaxID=2715437 RepID=A0ABW2NLB7_9BACL
MPVTTLSGELLELKRENEMLRRMLMQNDKERLNPYFHFLEQTPIHLFRLARVKYGEYIYTYSCAKRKNAKEIQLGESFLKSLKFLFHEEKLEECITTLEKAFSGKKCTVDFSSNGTLYTVTLLPLPGLNGTVTEITGSTVEYSRKNFSEDHDSRHSGQFQELFVHAMDALVLCNEKMEIMDVNPAGCSLLGLQKEELIYEPAERFLQLPDEVSETFNWNAFLSLQKHHGEVKIICGQGDVKDISYFCKPDLLPGLHLIVLQDVTELRVTEQKLIKAETLNVVGELAAGIAHEIRNPLTSLKGFIQLIQMENTERPEYFKIILNEVDRIEYIIKEFLLLAKNDTHKMKVQNVSAMLWDTVALLQTQALLKGVELKANLQEMLPDLLCDIHQLKQVFINYIKNAIEATPPAGTVCVQAHSEKGILIVKISDTGAGMDEKTLSKIGSPFFTTKEEGTGLGLMVSHKIIKNHQGTFSVMSEKGKGTEFCLSFPLAK